MRGRDQNEPKQDQQSPDHDDPRRHDSEPTSADGPTGSRCSAEPTSLRSIAASAGNDMLPMNGLSKDPEGTTSGRRYQSYERPGTRGQAGCRLDRSCGSDPDPYEDDPRFERERSQWSEAPKKDQWLHSAEDQSDTSTDTSGERGARRVVATPFQPVQRSR